MKKKCWLIFSPKARSFEITIGDETLMVPNFIKDSEGDYGRVLMDSETLQIIKKLVAHI